MVRVIEQVLRAHRLLEVPPSVVNKPGAGGDIAWKSRNQQGADGHHIALATKAAAGDPRPDKKRTAKTQRFAQTMHC